MTVLPAAQLLSQFNEPVWRVSWSAAGNVLAVASGEGKISLWKETLEGEWACVSDVAGSAGSEGAA